MKYQGFVSIPRSVQVLPIWGNATDTAVWLYCVLHASHKHYRRLEPGQFYDSQAHMAKVMGFTRKTVGISLNRLAEKGLLYVEASELGTVITVLYWDEISSGRGFEDEDDGKPAFRASLRADDDSTDEWMDAEPPQQKNAYREEQFREFWSIYPKKSNKAEAKKAFMQMDADPERIIRATNEAKYSKTWVIEEGRFIPNPVKWLDGGWEQFDSEPKPVEEDDDEDEMWVTR